MDDRIWYVYQNSQQMGPFEGSQIRQLYTNSMIAHDAYVFKVGWKDWRPLDDCLEEMGLQPRGPLRSMPSGDPQKIRPRATIQGRVDFHNNTKFNSGVGVNISSTGIFVETSERMFEVGEILKVTVRIDGIDTPFNAVARVIRYNMDPKHPIGYGLMFEHISSDIQKKIQVLVDSQDANARLRTGSI